MDDKKTNLYLLLSFILNFCLTFTMIWTLGLLFYMNTRLDDLRTSCVAPVKKEAIVQKTPISIDIEVNDNGFTNNSFDAVSDSDLTVVLRNTGLNPHSFVIDELGVNSGIVEPGNFKVIAISLSDRPATYNFYSNAPSDATGVFSGVLTVYQPVSVK